MKLPFEGRFDAALLYEAYDLRFIDVYLLNWFVSQAISGQLPIQTFSTGPAYKLDYEKLSFLLGVPKRQVRDAFGRLCTTNGEPKPLNRFIELNGPNSCSYYAPNRDEFPKFVLWGQISPHEKTKLEAFIMKTSASLFDVPEPKKLERKSKKLNPQCYQLLVELCGLKMGDQKLFSTTPPEDEHRYTQLIWDSQNMLMDLYAGTFLKNQPVSDDFMDWYPQFFEDGKALSNLKNLKGNWVKIRTALLDAAANYKLWLSNAYEPISKKNLPRSIKDWLYNPRAAKGGSTFLACWTKTPELIHEAFADEYYKKLPEAIASMAEELIQPEWDPIQVWKRIYETYKWAKATHQRKDIPNLQYWFVGGVKGWFKRYFAWLSHRWGGDKVVHITNLGINNPTFQAWVQEGSKQHNLVLKKLLK